MPPGDCSSCSLADTFPMRQWLHFSAGLDVLTSALKRVQLVPPLTSPLHILVSRERERELRAGWPRGPECLACGLRKGGDWPGASVLVQRVLPRPLTSCGC
jgi:hypothetical protein